jgi:deoxyribonuclease V
MTACSTRERRTATAAEVPDEARRILAATMWPEKPPDLTRLQRQLASRRPAPWHLSGPRPLVGGCFVCFARRAPASDHEGELGWAAAALTRGDRHPAGTTVVRGHVEAPYRPGLLALREGHLLESAVRALPERPEVVIANATGRDHPRGAGLALHLGAVLDLPSVGVTDRPLLASGTEPGARRGPMSPLLLDGAEVARLVRTRAGARPLVVHPGWRTDLDTAVSVVLAAIRRARTPEPLRRARREARRTRAAEEDGLR